MASVSQRLVRSMCGASYEKLPSAVVEHARTLMLDTRMVAHAGAGLPDVQAVLALTRQTGGAAQSRIWSCGTRVPAPEAAFVNSLSASALDYDSLLGNVHPDAIVLPAAWAMAEAEQRSGRDFIRAFVLGSELTCRLAQAAKGPQKGWTIGAVAGTFGAAMAASMLLDLTEEQTVHALGLCLSMAAGSQQSNVEQVLAKRLQPALAARAGLQAARLAGVGMTAPREVFEGRFGLWSLYFPCEPERLLRDLGDDYLMLRTGLKKYPVCACSHAAMDALLAIMRDHAVAAEDIVRVEAVISPFMDRLVGGGFDPSANPQVTAQFSLRYGLAAVALRGRLGVADLSTEAVQDPRVAEFTRRVELVIDPHHAGELAPATVRVTLRSGTLLEQTVDRMPGSAEAPLSEAERRAKFVECAGANEPSEPESLVDKFAALFGALEEVDDLSALVMPDRR